MPAPLAERMRPKTLNDFAGQEHLVGKSGIIRKSLEKGQVPSMIFWGPPGVGKTTLAYIIAERMKVPFYALSAINSGVKDVRETIDKAKRSKFFDQANPILFIDEIHRFSKSQQDSLLGAVERGIVTLIGATTENPSFEVISALLSRAQVYVLKPLEKEQLLILLEKAILQDEELKKYTIELIESEMLLQYSGGDARKLYNSLEIVVQHLSEQGEIKITNEHVKAAIQQNPILYDKAGEGHFDTISAFIKSIRGSDPNAAVYYLARMIEGGEDPKFICRRMIISASEDIGLANPNALLLANTCFETVQKIGLPEGRIPMAQTAIYLACCEKSNTAYLAIKKAQHTVKETGNLSIPLSIRNAPTSLMEKLDYGKDYKYAHDFENQFTAMEFLPEEISGLKFFEMGNSIPEKRMREFLKNRWNDKYGY
jgi:putative ATPase